MKHYVCRECGNHWIESEGTRYWQWCTCGRRTAPKKDNSSKQSRIKEEKE